MNAAYINVPIEVAVRFAQGTQTLADRQLLAKKLAAAVKRSDAMDAALEKAYRERRERDQKGAPS